MHREGRWRFWAEWSREQRLYAATLLLVAIAAVIHQMVWHDWFIEDAAISFAYTKHLVEGEGLVAWPGGERVEGYSNFTWVMLLAPLHAVGLSGFESAKTVAAILTMLTVPLVWGIVREAAPTRRAPALVAVVAFASHSQIANWHTSGLENALFSFFMALGLWRTFVELRTGGWPWAALAFFLLSATRPEAIMYGAFAGFLTMLFTLSDTRSPIPTLRWLATFFFPWTLYNGWRYSYFAYEFPQTYYAKMNAKTPQPWAWNVRGWRYVRNWAHANCQGYLVPIYLFGLIGHRGWRSMAVVAATFIAAFVVLFGSNARVLFPIIVASSWAMFYTAYRSGSGKPTGLATGLSIFGAAMIGASAEAAIWLGATFAEPPTPSWWGETPSYAMMALATVLPFLSIGSQGWRVRVTCWVLSTVGVFFAIYTQGDWMKNWRWMSLPAVPMTVLFGLGVGAFGDLFDDLFHERHSPRWRAAGWVAALAALGLFVGANIAQTNRAKRDPNPFGVKKRVDYKVQIAERLHIREKIVDLDVDMGAHMYWSDFVLMDIAGLVDIPLAQHKFERPFVEEYVFEEMRPHFAHVHASWATNSRIPTHAAWRRDYVEVPGYPAGNNSFHVGNHVRRELIFDTAWVQGDDRSVDLDDGITLLGWDMPSAVAAAKRMFYIEVGIDTRNRKKSENFRLLLFLSDAEQVVASWDLPPGYDWVMPHDWNANEIFHGRYSLRLPPGVEPGAYDIGFVFIHADGVPIQPTAKPDETRRPRRWKRSAEAIIGGTDAPALFASGEIRFADALRVVTLEERDASTDRAEAAAFEAIAAVRCKEAEEHWQLAVAHRPKDKKWRRTHKPAFDLALAGCWARAAEGEDPEVAVEFLHRARRLDHWAPEIDTVGAPVADALFAEAMQARSDEDWDVAYRKFSDVLKIDPSWSWARRHAEHARARNLRIDPEGKAAIQAEEKAAREERKRAAEARREARENKAAPALPQGNDEEGDE